ncbi:MAG: hypothetical protein PVG89_16165, partial [Gammaproteobacteria bacterium]
MKQTNLILPLMVLLPTVGLVACGGSGSGDGNSGSRTVGVVSSVDASSVTVGSTSFDASNASVNGDNGSTAPGNSVSDTIDPGMIVRVDGSV